jgi:two-component system, NarL family, response regulator NreC
MGVKNRILRTEFRGGLERDWPMNKQFAVIVADNHTILREGLNAILSSQPDLKVVGEASDGIEAIRSAQNHSPDLVLMDLSMPRMTGADAMKEIKRVNPRTKIIILTVHSTKDYILSALKAGADGYVLKEADRSELLRAIRQVLDGRRYLTPSISGTIIDRLLEPEGAPAVQSEWEFLTQREREIAKLVAEGQKSKEIAGLLCISYKTVEKHRANLMDKLGIRNVAALTVLASKEGLLSN